MSRVARRRPSITYREFAMNDDTPADRSVYAMRDHWKGQAQQSWQQIAELRQLLVLAIHGPLSPENIEWARQLLERTAQ